jgi:transposase-like protein
MNTYIRHRFPPEIISYTVWLYYRFNLIKSHGGEPRKIVTDKLRSYGVAHRELIYEATRVRAQHYRDLRVSAFAE